MSKIDKLIEKMKNRPKGIRFSEADKVLNRYGYILKRSEGSHRHYANSQGDVITIVENNPLKSVYVKDILERIGKK